MSAGAECGAWRLNVNSLLQGDAKVEGTGVHLKGDGGKEWSLEIDKSDPPGIFAVATSLYQHRIQQLNLPPFPSNQPQLILQKRSARLLFSSCHSLKTSQ